MDAGKMCPCQLGWPRELGLRFVHLVRISPKLLPSVVERVEVGDGVGRTAAVCCLLLSGVFFLLFAGCAEDCPAGPGEAVER